jgi:hypothetical protein
MITVRAIATVVEAWSRDNGSPVTWHEIVSVRRARAVCRARALVIWLARRHTSLSLPQIGRQLGGRDHTTILYNCRVVDALIAKADTDTQAAIAALEAALAPLIDEVATGVDVVKRPVPQRLVAYDRLVDAVEVVLTSADTAALARSTRQARAADLALAHALSALRSARTRVMAAGADGTNRRRVKPAPRRQASAARHTTAA